MKNKYRIYPEYNFGVAKPAPGYHNFEDLYSLAKQFREDPDFFHVHYMLTDLREAKFNFELGKIHQMIKLVNEYSKKDNQKIGVYLIDAPNGNSLCKDVF